LGRIDVTVDVHKVPNDPFPNAPTPLLATFPFRRDVPANETTPPTTLAQKQCAEVIEAE
jgi:hypothetical protein